MLMEDTVCMCVYTYLVQQPIKQARLVQTTTRMYVCVYMYRHLCVYA